MLVYWFGFLGEKTFEFLKDQSSGKKVPLLIFRKFMKNEAFFVFTVNFESLSFSR